MECRALKNCRIQDTAPGPWNVPGPSVHPPQNPATDPSHPHFRESALEMAGSRQLRHMQNMHWTNTATRTRKISRPTTTSNQTRLEKQPGDTAATNSNVHMQTSAYLGAPLKNRVEMRPSEFVTRTLLHIATNGASCHASHQGSVTSSVFAPRNLHTKDTDLGACRFTD